MKRLTVLISLCCVGVAFLLSSFYRSHHKNESIHMNHLALYIYDLKTSTDFYARVMELDSIPEPFHDGRHTWFHVGDHNQLHLISGNSKDQQHVKDTHTCFSVPDLEKFIEHLEKEKVNYTNWAGDSKTPTKRADGVRQVYFQDPDGYWIEVNNDTY